LANRLFWEPAHFIMDWKMLRTIKRLAVTARDTPEGEAAGSAEEHLVGR
jgi:hypothetical protein